MTEENKLKERIYMFFSGFLMGTVGLYVSELPNALTAASVRGIFGFFFLMLFLIIKRRISIFQMMKYTWKLQILQGFLSAIVIFFYFLGIQLLNYSISAFLLYTGGAFALVFCKIILKEHISKVSWFAFSFAILGVGFIMEPWNNFNTQNFVSEFSLGLIISLLSGICLGMSITTKKAIFKRMKVISDEKGLKIDAYFFIAMVTLPTIFLMLMFFPISYDTVLSFSSNEWIIAILLGFLPSAVAFSLYNLGLTKDEGGDIVIISYIEPIVASVLNIVKFGGIALNVLIGGVIIIVSNIIILKYSNYSKVKIIK